MHQDILGSAAYQYGKERMLFVMMHHVIRTVAGLFRVDGTDNENYQHRQLRSWVDRLREAKEAVCGEACE
jgi:hypothetical protein